MPRTPDSTPPEAMEEAAKMEKTEEGREQRRMAAAKALWEKGLGEKLGIDSFEKFQWRIKIVEIGGKTKDEIIAEIDAKGMEINDRARKMMYSEAFTTLPEAVETILVEITITNLGLGLGKETPTASWRNAWKSAQDLGLRLCPPEVGPHLRLADPNLDQLPSEGYWIGMEPIVDTDTDDAYVFGIAERDNKRLLYGQEIDREPWHIFDRMVFLAPET